MSTLISQPKSCEVNTVQKLGKYLKNVTAERWQEFRTSIQAVAKDDSNEFNPLKPAAQQSKPEWKALSDKTLQVFPELSEYEDVWPLHTYWNLLASNKLYKHSSPSSSPVVISRAQTMGPPSIKATNTKPRRATISAANRPSSSANSSRGTRSGNPYIGRPLTRNLRNKSASVRTALRVSEPPLNQAETSRRSFSVALSSSENVLRLAETPQRDVPDYDVEPEADAIWPEACYHSKCGMRPRVSPTASTKLNHFIETCDISQDILTSLGIFHDRHFSLLLKLGKADLNAFLSGLVPQFLDDLKAFHLEFFLNRYKETADSKESKPSTKTPDPYLQEEQTHTSNGIILRPSPALEGQLKTSICPLDKIKESMKMNEENYFDLMHLAQQKFGTIISSSASVSFDKISKTKWQSFEDSVCSGFPMLNFYEDLWPLEIVVKRFLRQNAEGVDSGEDTESRHTGNAGSFGSLRSKIIQTFYCAKHPLPPSGLLDDISPEIAKHFTSLDLPELIPGAMLIGIKTYQDLERIWQWYDDATLQSLMHGVQGASLTQFHRMLMCIALRKHSPGPEDS